MNTKDVRMDARCKLVVSGIEGLIVDYRSGWVHVEKDNGDIEKCRAKNITLIESKLDDPVPHADTLENIFKQEGIDKPIVRLKPDMSNYIVGLGVTHTGRSTVDIDDEAAAMLRRQEGKVLNSGKIIENVVSVIERVGYKKALSKSLLNDFNNSAPNTNLLDFLLDRYEHLNPGMVRMNCGNLLRRALLVEKAIPRAEDKKTDPV